MPFLLDAYAKLIYFLTIRLVRALYKEGKTESFSPDRHKKMIKLSRYSFKVFEGIASIVGKRNRENYTMAVGYEGCRLLIRPFSHILDILMVSGLWEPYVKAVIEREVKKTDVIVDVGANIGVYAVPLAKRASKIIAFEPHPKTSEMLETSVRLNQLHNVEIIKKAVSDSQQRVLQDISDSFAAYSRIVTDHSKKDPAIIEVESTKLDTALRSESNVDWLLIDVEGYEVNVLCGAYSILRKFSPKIIVEVQPENVLRVGNLLTDHGYELTNLYGIYYYAKKPTLSNH
jgi:FkbM family methyltransferase